MDSIGERKKEDVEVPLFDFTTIVTATNKFSQANVIGAGGFGPVYKGHLCNGQDIAVKRLSKDSRQGLKQFKNEVVLIAKLQHRNLVSHLGYCIQGDERMLISRTFGGDESEVKTDRVVGTYGYISPEYAVDVTFSLKSDVFSLGVLMLEIKFPEDRPAMSCVLSMLTNAEAILPEPKQPGFFIERSSSNAGATSRNEESSIENAVTITMPEAR
ncbi:G-type lectin S-receptor-like serine/threonine-protein kinase At4g27290 [Castanea sativa]|uniref:G-type lectin S-receptor-like serine/threonine-protein kinase At4g27290 n=1 Tax=Castanea sativa TaxID=21020 RepID=UPI003F64FD8C